MKNLKFQKLREVKPMNGIKSITSRTTCLMSAVFASMLSLSSAMADDTEVFFGQVDPNLDIFPNVLFVLDTSGSMTWPSGDGDKTRLESMKDALDVILDNATNVNVGVMRFNGSNGGGSVLFPVTPIDKEICEQGACGEVSAAPRVSQSAGDSEQTINTGATGFGGNDLAIGKLNGNDRIVGLQFNDLQIPQGATITSAKLELTSNNNSTDSAEFEIFGELTPDASLFTNQNNDLSNRDRTTASTDWPINEEWVQNGTYQSPQIKGLLQEIVNQAGWCGGNSASLLLFGTGQRSAMSYDNSPSDAPILKYTYDDSNVPAGGGCVEKTLVSQVSASSDDAEQFLGSGDMSLRSEDLELPFDRGNEQRSGVRFTNVQVPADAIITDARIEFEVDRQRWGTVSLSIHGQNSGNPSTFESRRRNITNRPRTGAVAWNDIPNPAVNSKVTTPNLAPIVQSLVNRNDWDSGNAMAFLFSRASGNGYREFESIDGEPVNAPKLRITYRATVDGSEPTIITAREKLKEVVNGLTAVGGTPIVDAYYEASQYFRGGAVDYGRTRGVNFPGNQWFASDGRYHRVSVPESYTGDPALRDQRCTDSDLDSYYCHTEQIPTGATYNTPFRSSCQTNHIVFLSDGAATSNSSANKVKALTGKSSCKPTQPDRWGNYPEECGEELAEWLFENDHSAGLTGKQNISTYTIGFNFSSDFLRKIASAGDGAYFQAESSAQLVDVFQSILGDVLSVDTSFVAPGATVNQFNRLTHRDDIYFALFKPDTRPSWDGNLKRYEIGSDESGEVSIMDVHGNKAVDESSGFFAPESQSWWSDGIDGSQVSKGGAAAELFFSDTNPRKVYTYVGSNENIPYAGVDLTLPAQTLSENNNAITLAHLGIENADGTDADRAAYRESLLKWARGIDLKDDDEDNDTNDWRKHMGDPMHARPVILNYENGNSPYTTIFLGTNDGYLHAVDREEGKELYSFVPQELLGNFHVFWNNQSSDGHPYGLDGALSIWHTDDDNDVTIDATEKAFLYTGMRRGGSSYFALDVSKREAPKLAWVLDPSVTGFEELGQTWSKMTPAKILYQGDIRNVLIFGAGYDVNQDLARDANNDRVARTTANRGRGIYIVDAETGKLVYSVLGVDQTSGADGGHQKFDSMDYSIPSDINTLDTDFDGVVDQMYASDSGGQIWRFDFDPYHGAGSTNPLIAGGVIADLNANGLAGERRFYYEPDVALISDKGDRFLSISIGSGWRAHPLDLIVDDRFYMIKSPSVFGAPKGYGKSTDGGKTFSPIVEADLIDATNQLNPETNEFGWYYDLDAKGEKVLGASVTADNKVFFTTYRPALAVGACTTAIGGGSIYALNIISGGPVLDLNGDGEIDLEDAELPLAQGGIPPPPLPIITDKDVMITTGPTLIDPEIDDLTYRTYWVDKDWAENEQ